MNFVSILDKLVLLNTRILVSLIFVFLLAIFAVMTFVFNTNVDRISSEIEESLVRKGNTLVKNNSIALSSLVADNAFTSVLDLVEATVSQDSDVVHGIFMDGDRRAWVYAEDGTDGAGLSTGDKHLKQLDDKMSLWADKISKVSYRSNLDNELILEFAAPVEIDGQRLGTIRYGITLKPLKTRLTEARARAAEMMYRFLGFLAIFAGISVIVGRYLSRKQALGITSPIESLKEASQAIAEGNYQKTIEIETNDEVGYLAENFDLMRTKIRDYTENLESMVRERTQQLEEAQKIALDNAHKAGMAEIATGTLHSVGNLLNSVNTSTGLLKDVADRKRIEGLHKANQMLSSELNNLEEFILHNPKGKKLVEYYYTMSERLIEDNERINEYLSQLKKETELITETIHAQQAYANTDLSFIEKLDLNEMIEVAFSLQAETLRIKNVETIVEIPEDQLIEAQKNKFIQVLINIIKNAVDAMENSEHPRIRIYQSLEDGYVRLFIEDNGIGISETDQQKIFQYGFTTKPEGHGFGLHTCANAMNEMGGKLSVVPNEGGAIFLIEVKQA